jgi:pimeloyl-ACP methyl ester carboxylesterase
MASIALNGFQLHYEIAGQGTPVIFLHGLGSSADDWALQVPTFAARHQTITLDLRGHGQSPCRGPLSIPQMAGDVAELLKHLSLRAHVVGLSLGGCVAISLGADHPDRARSLTLVNTFARYRPIGLRGLRRGVARLWLLQTRPVQDMAAFVARGLFPRPEQRPLYEAAVASLSRNSRETYRAAIAAIWRFDARTRLADIRCPTLVVLGERDETVARASGEALARGIPGARRWLVADSGHATPMDQPEVFNATVLEFLEKAEGGRH